MKKRQIIIILAAIAIVYIGRLGMQMLGEPTERKVKETTERIVTVFTETVKLGDVEIQVKSTGSLEAKDRMELYSEVQGMMLPDKGRFKAGTRFQKGDLLLGIRNDNVLASTIALRAAFASNLSTTMADIRIDFNEAFATWSSYLNSIDPEKTLPSLPEVSNSKFKSYLNGKNVFADYYNVRNAEIGLSRFGIKAPFSGVLTDARVNPGTVIRPGQLLGVFVQPGVYELRASTDAKTLQSLVVGKTVAVTSESTGDTSFPGKISRINVNIDPETQMSEFFVELRSKELKEGMFMSLDVDAKTIQNAYELNRAALRDSKFAYVVENDALRKITLEILHKSESTVVVRGLESGQVVLSKLPPSAFEGMKVNIYNENAAQ
ncbi:MAG: membrane fusion protein (multidrug efflux system) [Luteibaculaceae bacterium]|jgi:membrane fusion protein (multidrug efflux system)